LNERAPSDTGGLITAAELRDAQAPLIEPATGAPGVTYFAAVDLGVKVDWSTLLIGHVDGDGRLVIDVVRTWKPGPAGAVSLMDVGQELRALFLRFPWRRLCLDQSQSRLIAEQLTHENIPAEVLEIGAGEVNRLVTGLKGAFARRLVRIPSHATDLVEQLESVQAVETRRGLLKLQEGSASSGDARGHDDLAFALALLIDMVGESLGRAGTLPAQDVCYREVSLGRRLPSACYIWARDVYGGYLPSGDPSCAACPSHTAVLEGWRKHCSDPRAEPIDLRGYRQRYVLGDNAMVREKQAQEGDRWADNCL
jgi:hypothetical protein